MHDQRLYRECQDLIRVYDPGEVRLMLGQRRDNNQGFLPDNLKTILHTAYFSEISDYLDNDSGYVETIRDRQFLTKKAVVNTMTHRLFDANQLPELPGAEEGNVEDNRKMSKLTSFLIGRHSCLERLIHEVPDNTPLHEKTHQYFFEYAQEAKFGKIMRHYKKIFEGMNKGHFVKAMALKFFYDSMTAVYEKEESLIDRPIRRIDRKVNTILNAAFRQFGLNDEKYLNNLKNLIFEIPDLMFMAKSVSRSFVSMIKPKNNHFLVTK